MIVLIDVAALRNWVQRMQASKPLAKALRALANALEACVRCTQFLNAATSIETITFTTFHSFVKFWIKLHE